MTAATYLNDLLLSGFEPTRWDGALGRQLRKGGVKVCYSEDDGFTVLMFDGHLVCWEVMFGASVPVAVVAATVTAALEA